MERLTERDGLIVKTKFNSDYGSQNILQRLADYEDAEEQGLLLRLPFRKGQTVYYIDRSCITNMLMICSMVYSYSCLDFPREYFATKEEAEAKLKEMECE